MQNDKQKKKHQPLTSYLKHLANEAVLRYITRLSKTLGTAERN